MTPVRLALLAAALAAPAAAQPDPAALRGDSPQTRKRLAEAEQKIAAGKPGDAADDLQRVLDDAADELVSPDGKHYLPARTVAQQLLARLPAPALATYRDRVEEPARKLLDAGTRDRDPRPLRRLADRFFVSRPAEPGLLLLGDLLFEAGDFRGAEAAWRRLVPGDGNYPQPKSDPAAAWARAILAAAFQGETDRAAAELADFRKRNPTAAGRLAGADGPFADTLQRVIAARPAVPPAAADGWATFAGGPARGGSAAGPLARHWPARPTWTTPLPLDPAAARDARPVFAPARPPFGHPIVAGGRVYVADGDRVFALDRTTGRAVVAFGAPPAPPPPPRPFDPRVNPFVPRTDPPPPPDPPASLTAAGGRVFARVGPSVPAEGRPEVPAIVCLASGDGPELKEVWRLVPPAAEGGKPAAVWEGAPLVAGNRLWAAAARFEGGRVVHAVACYDPADADAAPARPAWVTEVCDGPLPDGGPARPRRELLTLAGPHVLFNSNAGAVVALDAATGRRAWGFKYPRAARRPGFRPPALDPAPCVAAGGRVFVAPVDSDRVFALDAGTGELLWESRPTEGAEILGVTRGRVVVTTTGPVRSIRGLSVRTGAHGPAGGGWIQHDPGTPLPYGRGLVADDAVLWPTRAGLFVLNPDTGLPLTALRRRFVGFGHAARPAEPAGFPASATTPTYGNLAAADGFLVGVGATEVFAWVPEKVLFAAAGATPDPFADLPAGPPPGPAPAAARPAEVLPPQLRADAAEDHALELPPHAVPLRPLPGGPPATRFVVAAGADLLAVPVDGRPTEHAAAGAFGFAADFGPGFVAAGPHAVAVYGAAREPEWAFRPPDPTAAELDAFALAGEMLVARLGPRHLLGLDLTSRRVAWVLGADGGARFAPVGFPWSPAFGPHLAATPRELVAQLTTGRRWSIDPRTGRILGEYETARTPWDGPPAALESGRFLVADGPGAVRLTGPGGWGFAAGGGPSLAGTPPQVRAFGGDVFVAVRRNHGVELERLDAATGRRRWAGDPPLLEADRIDLAAADADPLRVFVPLAGKLVAVRRENGRTAWETALPPGGWRVRAGTRVVTATPAEAVPIDPAGDRLARSFLRAPHGWRLPGLAATAYHAWADRTAPVLLFDPDSGRLVKRLDLPATGPGVAAAFADDRAAVATGRQVTWLK